MRRRRSLHRSLILQRDAGMQASTEHRFCPQFRGLICGKNSHTELSALSIALEVGKSDRSNTIVESG